MTELQMGLIGLGAAAVVGVLAYNKWQERRHRKLAESMLKPGHDDVLLGDESPPKKAARSEPELRDEVRPGGAGRREPVMSDSDGTDVGATGGEEMPLRVKRAGRCPACPTSPPSRRWRRMSRNCPPDGFPAA